MAAILDDRVEELVSMKEVGERCMAAADERRDDRAFMMWQRCVSRLESLLVTVGHRH